MKKNKPQGIFVFIFSVKDLTADVSVAFAWRKELFKKNVFLMCEVLQISDYKKVCEEFNHLVPFCSTYLL